MVRRRLFALLVGLVLVLAGTAAVATPAQAATAATCTVTAEKPWHSLPPLNNRVYFNSHVTCTGNSPWLIRLYNAGHKNGSLVDYENKNCTNSYSCYSTGGQTYVAYTGRAEYCTVAQTWDSSTSIAEQYKLAKTCATF